MRIIGMDIHREFAEVVALDGTELTHLSRVKMTRDNLAAFAVKLETTDHIVLETTGNTTVVVEILSPHVARVAVANPLQVHLIVKAKTDKIDAGVWRDSTARDSCPRSGPRTKRHWRGGTCSTTLNTNIHKSHYALRACVAGSF